MNHIPIVHDSDTWARMEAKYIPEPNSGCWLWFGGHSQGYGRIWHQGKVRPAHRVSYELHCGPISDDLEPDHLCRVPACINPAHLEPVTRSINQKRGLSRPPLGVANRAKTHCPYGHPFSGSNLVIQKNGQRRCRECTRRRGYEAYLKRSGKMAA